MTTMTFSTKSNQSSELFTGDRLRIARQRRSLTKKRLAELLSVTPRTVSGWEADEYPPEHDNLANIIDVLSFPASFYFRDESAHTSHDAVSFRSLSRTTAKQRDAVLAMCDIAKDLAKWLDHSFELPSVDIPDLFEEIPDFAATLLRQRWGIGNKPVKHFISLLESKGVKIFALPENCREIDACSFWSDSTPFILLNTEMSGERIRFDLAHELGHLVLHKHGAPMGREAEQEANLFASEFLMPEDGIRVNRPKVWSIQALMKRKKPWGVSISALAYRAHQLGYISEWHFKSLNIEMRRRGYKDREPEGMPKEQSKVLEVVLAQLRNRGLGVPFIANQNGLPQSEIQGLFFGLAKVVYDGDLNAEDSKNKVSHLRLVK